jgi:hypothetical protein
MPVTTIAKIKQQNASAFSILDDIDLNGGFRVVANIAARDAIASDFRKEGMYVKIQGGSLYELDTDLTTWVEVTFSSGTTIVADEASLPVSGDVGDMVFAEAEQTLWIWNGSTWLPAGGSGGVGSVGGVTPNIAGGDVDIVDNDGVGGITIVSDDVTDEIKLSVDSLDGGSF